LVKEKIGKGDEQRLRWNAINLSSNAVLVECFIEEGPIEGRSNGVLAGRQRVSFAVLVEDRSNGGVYGYSKCTGPVQMRLPRINKNKIKLFFKRKIRF
jgi:hypothetical protein